jgi:hypothetical protein
MVVELSGGSAMTSIRAESNAYQFVGGALPATSLFALVRGDLAAGALLRIEVRDKTKLPQVRATEVVSRKSDGYRTLTPASYSFSVVAVP